MLKSLQGCTHLTTDISGPFVTCKLLAIVQGSFEADLLACMLISFMGSLSNLHTV